MIDHLYQAYRGGAAVGFVARQTDDNAPAYVVNVAPLLRWLLGRPLNEAIDRIEAQGWRVVRLPDTEKACETP